VIDYGSGMCMSFAGDETPRVVFPSMLRRDLSSYYFDRLHDGVSGSTPYIQFVHPLTLRASMRARAQRLLRALA